MLIAVLAAGPQRQLQFARLLHAEDELPESSPQRQLRVDERPEGCKDERPDCAGWAADGECEANPGYMMTACAHSCTRCAEGPSGVGVMRSKKERAGRRDSACDNLDDDCEARVAAGGCHDGSDTPLRCPSGCRICRFPEVAKEAYGCSAASLFGSCERRRRRCARPPDTPPLVTPGDIDVTMRRILTDFPQYSPRAISRPVEGAHAEGERVAPWVITLQDFLSDDEVGPPPRAAAEPSPSPCAPAPARPKAPIPGPSPSPAPDRAGGRLHRRLRAPVQPELRRGRALPRAHELAVLVLAQRVRPRPAHARRGAAHRQRDAHRFGAVHGALPGAQVPAGPVLQDAPRPELGALHAAGAIPSDHPTALGPMHTENTLAIHQPCRAQGSNASCSTCDTTYYRDLLP